MADPTVKSPGELLYDLAEAVKSLARVVRTVEARLTWYETRVPILREEFAAFTAEQISTQTPNPKPPFPDQDE